MKKLVYAVTLLLLGAFALTSCSKSSEEEDPNGDVSIVGTWIAYNLDVLDEFAYGVTERIACSDMKVTFSEDGKATFRYSGNTDDYPATFSGTYTLVDKGEGKFLVNFPDGLYNGEGDSFRISDVFMPADGGSLTIIFGMRSWDWYDQWYFSKQSDK